MKRILLRIAVLWIAVFVVVDVTGKPGGIYALTGEEKSIAGIIQADMEKYPELYQGNSLSRCVSKFKK